MEVTAVPYQSVHDSVPGYGSLQNGSWYFLLNDTRTTLYNFSVQLLQSNTHFMEHLALDCTWKYFLFVKITVNSVASKNACTGPKLILGTTQSPACPALCSKMNGPPLQGGDASDVFLFCANALEKHKQECATLPVLKVDKRGILLRNQISISLAATEHYTPILLSESQLHHTSVRLLLAISYFRFFHVVPHLMLSGFSGGM